mmetsp:Transcript_4624/g.10879  ORF Transcript_4624/g.10879 Transcript_4624/m.10879 type:complete len:220 (+) Transcript_4624:477-1136(+)
MAVKWLSTVFHTCTPCRPSALCRRPSSVRVDACSAKALTTPAAPHGPRPLLPRSRLVRLWHSSKPRANCRAPSPPPMWFARSPSRLNVFPHAINTPRSSGAPPTPMAFPPRSSRCRLLQFCNGAPSARMPSSPMRLPVRSSSRMSTRRSRAVASHMAPSPPISLFPPSARTSTLQHPRSALVNASAPSPPNPFPLTSSTRSSAHALIASASSLHPASPI